MLLPQLTSTAAGAAFHVSMTAPDEAGGNRNDRAGRQMSAGPMDLPKASLRPTRGSVVALLAVAALFALMLSTVGFGAGHDHEHGTALPATDRIGDVELTISSAVRLTDGHAGANSPKLPMGGEAMPMAGGGHIQGATDTGQERIAVSVRLHNQGTAAVSYDALDVHLRASGRAAELLRPVESTLGAGVLPPGARIAGEVYFVVKDGTQELSVRHAGSHRDIPLGEDVTTGGAGGGHGH